MALDTRSRLSRHKKKAWRKVNINDIEEFLEGERVQERTGGLASMKPDDQLFFLDKAPKPAKSAKKDALVSQSRITRRKEKSLKCYSNLEPDPRIPAISKFSHGAVRKSRPPPPGSALSKKATRSTLEARTAPSKVKDISPGQIKDGLYDLWSSGEKSSVLENHFATVTRKKPVKAPRYLTKKPSILPAVEPPHPGSSYNPAFDDHQLLLHSAVSVEIQKEIEAAKIERQLRVSLQPNEKPATQETWMKEMSAGLGLDDEEHDEGEALGDLDQISCNPPVNRDAKKTLQQRRREKEKLQEKLDKEKKKIERNRHAALNQLKAIKRELSAREERLLTRAERRKCLREKSATNPQRLSKVKYTAPTIDVALSGELTGSMRLNKCESSLMEDRFKSLQKRNIIEPRNRAKFHRKHKPKYPEKRQCKQITVTSKVGGIVEPAFS